MARTRKTPQSWIQAGLTALKSSGPEALKAEALARDLETTKGSFYWHFKDVPAFHKAVLAAWAKTATAKFDAILDGKDTPLAALRAVGSVRLTPLDRAVRAWAAHHTGARKTVTTFDTHVQARIAALLAEQGATHPDFPGLIHASILSVPPTGQHTETLIDLLLVLK